MPARTPSASLDLSPAEPVIHKPTNKGNDPGSTTHGVGTTSKGKRAPLIRSGGSGGGSGSGQSLLGFSSRKNAPLTPDKKAGAGKRTLSGKAGSKTVDPVQIVNVDKDRSNTPIEGVSGVPLAGWDPLLLGSGQPTKEMQRNLDIHVVDDEQDARGQGTTGLAVRKAMIRADERIRALRVPKASVPGKTKASGRGKGKLQGGLDPADKRWNKVFKESWAVMGGEDIAPIHTTPKSHTRIHHILRVFDLSPKYGPCVGISRLARWERAHAWGLEPPQEVREILETQEGAEDVTYRETVFEGTGIYCPTA